MRIMEGMPTILELIAISPFVGTNPMTSDNFRIARHPLGDEATAQLGY